MVEKEMTNRGGIRVTIYSDGRIETLSNEDITIDELSGKLDVLHDILKIYKNNIKNNSDKTKVEYPYPLNYSQIYVYMQTAGTNNFIKVPRTHLDSFAKYIVDKSGTMNFGQE